MNFNDVLNEGSLNERKLTAKNLKAGDKVLLQRKPIYSHNVKHSTEKETVKTVDSIVHKDGYSTIRFKGMKFPRFKFLRPFKLSDNNQGVLIVTSDNAKYQIIDWA